MVRKTERIATHDAKPTAGFDCVTRGRYPRLAVPAQRDCTRSSVMMPSGRVLPKPPGSRGDEPRPAGTALAPPAGVTRPASWYVGEIRCLVPYLATICQAVVLLFATERSPASYPEVRAKRASKDAQRRRRACFEARRFRVEHLSMTRLSGAPVTPVMRRDRGAVATAAPCVSIDGNTARDRLEPQR